MKFFEGFGVAQGKIRFCGDPGLLALFCPNFHPIMHFQWDNKMITIIPQVAALSRRMYTLHRVLSIVYKAIANSNTGQS